MSSGVGRPGRPGRRPGRRPAPPWVGLSRCRPGRRPGRSVSPSLVARVTRGSSCSVAVRRRSPLPCRGRSVTLSDLVGRPCFARWVSGGCCKGAVVVGLSPSSGCRAVAVVASSVVLVALVAVLSPSVRVPARRGRLSRGRRPGRPPWSGGSGSVGVGGSGSVALVGGRPLRGSLLRVAVVVLSGSFPSPLAGGRHPLPVIRAGRGSSGSVAVPLAGVGSEKPISACHKYTPNDTQKHPRL